MPPAQTIETDRGYQVLDDEDVAPKQQNRSPKKKDSGLDDESLQVWDWTEPAYRHQASLTSFCRPQPDLPDLRV